MHLTRSKRGTLEQRQFYKKEFECQIRLRLFLPCHNETAFLFSCSIFSNCRDHNFKLNICNKSWQVGFAGFLLPIRSAPPLPHLCLAHKLTLADPPSLSCWGAILVSVPALGTFFSQLSSPYQQGHAWCSHFPHLLSVCLCVCYCFPSRPPPPNQKNMIRDSNTWSLDSELTVPIRNS